LDRGWPIFKNKHVRVMGGFVQQVVWQQLDYLGVRPAKQQAGTECLLRQRIGDTNYGFQGE
jgi:hypothetical protein